MPNNPAYRNIKAVYSIKTPAKINVGLRLLSKRSDGYHNIETIFYPVKLFDIVHISVIPSTAKHNITVSTEPDIKVKPQENICYIAANLFLEKFVRNRYYEVNIKIRKNIPVGAGLGGGSSDAGAVLKALCRYFKINISSPALKSIALACGSDVPFFLLCKPVFASGRGEKLVLLPEFRINYDILLVYPGTHISTRQAYSLHDIKKRKIKILHKVKKFDPYDNRLMINDFEKVVFKLYPVIEIIKYDMIKCGAIYSLMSGSGSVVFGFYPRNKISVKRAAVYFRRKGYKTYIA